MFFNYWTWTLLRLEKQLASVGIAQSVLAHSTECSFSCLPEAACGDLDETHINYAEEKTQK